MIQIIPQISELLQLTSNFTNRPDQVQGPGGNTSVKSDDGKMYIKASGFRFEELSENNGISAVNSYEISRYFRNVIPKDKEVDEKEMLELIASNILLKHDGSSYPKPSMETGFHAVLGKYVVHTHSVWSNLLNCCSERLNVLKKLKLPYKACFIPFVSPGFGLSYLITNELKNAESSGESIPEVFFLANHGIIAHANELQKCYEILNTVDLAIQKLLNLGVNYPEMKIEAVGNSWESRNSFVTETIIKLQCDKSFFDNVLFPDQTVFFKDRISDSNDAIKKTIDLKTDGSIQYNCSYRDAISIHETMTAYLYLYDVLTELDLPMEFIKGNEIDYINNMEMEKHRRGMTKDQEPIGDKTIGR